MQEVVLIVHNVRSTHNVGSLLRSADGFGVSHVYFTGYTPYPKNTTMNGCPILPINYNGKSIKLH
jgi:23S rRNA (guanosine2251-2'-O)-methyltransferase